MRRTVEWPKHPNSNELECLKWMRRTILSSQNAINGKLMNLPSLLIITQPWTPLWSWIRFSESSTSALKRKRERAWCDAEQRRKNLSHVDLEKKKKKWFKQTQSVQRWACKEAIVWEIWIIQKWEKRRKKDGDMMDGWKSMGTSKIRSLRYGHSLVKQWTDNPYLNRRGVPNANGPSNDHLTRSNENFLFLRTNS